MTADVDQDRLTVLGAHLPRPLLARELVFQRADQRAEVGLRLTVGQGPHDLVGLAAATRSGHVVGPAHAQRLAIGPQQDSSHEIEPQAR
jgi:hypothetical protein